MDRRSDVGPPAGYAWEHVSSTAARNVAIIFVLALAVFALPGGGVGAAVVSALIGIAFSVGIWLLLMRMYRENRTTIFGLGDTFRLIFYASCAALLYAGASAGKWWDSGPLTVLWLAMLGAAIYGLVATYRHWRSY